MNRHTSISDKIGRFARGGVLYGAGSIANVVLGFFLVKIYTTFLSVDQYGLLGLLLAFQHITIGMFALGLPQALLKSHYNEDSAELQDDRIFTYIAVTLTSGVIMLTVSCLGGRIISGAMLGDSEYYILLILTVISAFFSILMRLPLIVLRLREKIKLDVLGSSGVLGLEVVVIYALAYFLDVGISGMLTGQIVCRLVITITLFHVAGIRLNGHFSVAKASSMLAFGMPLILVAISNFVFTFIDRFMLNVMVGLEEVGIYNLGYQVGMVLSVLMIRPLKYAWVPDYLSSKDDDNFTEYCSKMVTYTVLAGGLLFLMVALFASEAIYILGGADYNRSVSIVSVIAMAYWISGIRTTLDTAVYLKGKSIVKLYYSLVACISNILLNYYMIPLWGGYGAALATLISSILMIITVYIYNRKMVPVKYEWLRMLKIILSILGLYWIGTLINENTALNVFLKFILILILPLMLFMTGFFRMTELNMIRRVFKK